MSFHPHLLSLAVAAANALIAASWQGLLLAGLLAGLLAVLPGMSAARRWTAWGVAFLVSAWLNLAPMLWSGGQETATGGGMRLNPVWGLAVVGLGAGLSMLRVGQLITGAMRLRRLKRTAVPLVLPAELMPVVAGHRRVTVCSSAAVSRPSVAGFLHPSILLPPVLLERLSTVELRQVLLHEMEHVRRGDDWANLLQKLALAVFPLNLALWWIDHRLCAERELACDDRVLEATGAPKAYASCLTRVAEAGLLGRGLALALGVWERRPELSRRIYRILEQPTAGRVNRRLGRVQATGFACALGTAAAALPHLPAVVRFAPAPITIADVSHSPGTARFRTAALARTDQAQPREVLMKAKMPSPVPAAGLGRAVGRPRLRSMRAVAHVQRPHVARQRLTSVDFNQEMQGPRLVLTTFTATTFSSPAVYTVVPVANGWLIFQL